MGRLERKLLAILVLMAVVPLAVAFGLSERLFRRTLGTGLDPAVAEALTDAVRVYGDLVTAEKGRQRALATGLAGGAALRDALAAEDAAGLTALLEDAAAGPGVVSVSLVGGDRPPLAATGQAPAGRWRQDTVELPLPPGAPWTTLRYVFGLDAAFLERFDRMEDEVITPFRALDADRENLAAIYAWSLISSLGITVLVASVIALVAGGRVTRRLARLRRAMADLAAGELSTRVAPTGHDEIADLARDFNVMAEKLTAAQARLQYLSQVSAWQGIARRLAHEIKNPLTPILLSVQQVHERYRGDDDRFRRVLDTAREIVEQEVETLRRLVEDFSRFARLPQVTARPEDLAALARDLVAAHPEVPGLVAEVPETPVTAAVDRGLLRQALTNLVHNAAQAVGPTGVAPRIVLRVERPMPGRARLVVEDNGPGVAQSDRERIFEPYVTGRTEGTGLGLAIVKKIVLDHGGTVAVRDATGGGARFELELPAL